MRILLIEPDPVVARSIELMLRSDGMVVYTTDEGEDGIDLAKLYDYDLIVIEPILPDFAGFDIVKALRSAKIATPILVVCASDHVADKVKAFDLGADDYLTKPFHKDELVARVLALVRRAHGLARPQVTVGALTIDLAAQRVAAAGQNVHLTGKEYAILTLLALRKGMTVTKEMVLNHLYGGMDEPQLKIVDVFVCKLRRKLESHGAGGLIETVWGRGYLLREPASEAAAVFLSQRPKGRARRLQAAG